MKNSTKRFLLLIPSVILGTLLVVTVVSAATTIGTDITTAGSITASSTFIGPSENAMDPTVSTDTGGANIFTNSVPVSGTAFGLQSQNLDSGLNGGNDIGLYISSLAAQSSEALQGDAFT